MSKKAMIFAAGLGTRLYPITSDRPKALAEINGVTLLENAISYVSSFGFNEIIINSHHFAEKINEFFEQKKFPNIDIQISYEDILLDTAGGLSKAAYFFKPEDEILLYNVDVVTNININEMMEFHKKSKSDVSLAVQSRQTSRYFLFNKNYQLKGWTNELNGEVKPSFISNIAEYNKLAFSGLHILNYKVLGLLGESKKHSLTPFYLENLDEILISGYEVSENKYWFDCGKPDTLKAASEFLKNNI